MTITMAIEPGRDADLSISEVVKTYGKRLFRFVRGRVRNDTDAEDILQDVWYQFSRVVQLEPIEQISGWLYRVARNRLNDQYRREMPQSIEDFAYENEDGEVFLKDLLFPESETPESDLLKKTFWDTLWAALEELPEAQRNVFIWNELEDETFQSIADRTGENIKTLISRKRYAVQHLRARLDFLYQEIINP
jgi:RNA polymerase sigma factor (sigma-70 family)